MNTSLLEAKQAAERLEPIEQVRLLEYITQQVERFLDSLDATTKGDSVHTDKSWSAFFEAGDRLFTDDSSSNRSLTETLISMRR
jgi:hypothetical protein